MYDLGMESTTITAPEAGNRLAKALRFRQFLATFGAGLDTPEQVAALDAADWCCIAELAGERPPSVATVAAVQALVAAEDAARGTGPDDPFEGVI